MSELFNSGTGSSSIPYIITLFALGLLPLVLMATTSYLKISIVLSVLRNALGGGQIPSQALSGVLALLISAYTISPVFEKCINNMTIDSQNKADVQNKNLTKYAPKVVNSSNIESILNKIKYTTEPLILFLKLNTGHKERIYFTSLQLNRSIKSVDDNDKPKLLECPLGENDKVIDDSFEKCIAIHESISSLVLSFVSSELRSACTIGVYLFIPFLVVDLIISTILTGMGMMMVSPITISLPLKLLLFTLSDGWRSLIESLVLSYKVI